MTVFHLTDFDFELPQTHIARYPLPQRSASRLLCLDKRSGECSHRYFTDLPQLLSPLDLLVFNNTRVIPARWFGRKESGGRIELLIERILAPHQALVHIRSSKSPKAGSYLCLEQDVRVKVVGRQADLFEIICEDERTVLELLQLYGHIPLPSYMGRMDEISDKSRYQTVFATEDGAVAAPTAGLHFDEKLLATIQAKGVQTAFVTLHVGAGTFQPVREEIISNHPMHTEYLQVSAAVCERINATKAQGGRVIAVGTTTVRALETAAQSGQIIPYTGETRIFIYPGYNFLCVDAMITNFHLPKSSLLMLVTAFGGYEAVMQSYHTAINEEYRFYSYGDAMWIE
jgi:S-adenosylmethionine:tRNA ribosyltransferase-isomerase